MENRKNTIQNNKRRLKNLSLAAIFIALSTVLSLRPFAIHIYVYKFSLARIPIHLSGFLLGPVYGFVVGAVSDVVGYFIDPQGGAMLWGFTLTSGLNGLIAGLITKLKLKKVNISTIIITNILSTIICSILLNTYFLVDLLGKSYLSLLEIRVINAVLQGAAYVILEILLLPLLVQINKYFPNDIKIKSYKKRDKQEDK